MEIKCSLCEHQFKISREYFVDVFYACRLEDQNSFRENIDDTTVNSSNKVKCVIETTTCFDFKKKRFVFTKRSKSYR